MEHTISLATADSGTPTQPRSPTPTGICGWSWSGLPIGPT